MFELKGIGSIIFNCPIDIYGTIIGHSIQPIGNGIFRCVFIFNDNDHTAIFCVSRQIDILHYEVISMNAFYEISLKNDGIDSCFKRIGRHSWVIGFANELYFLKAREDILEIIDSLSYIDHKFVDLILETLKEPLFKLKSIDLSKIPITNKQDFSEIPDISFEKFICNIRYNSKSVLNQYVSIKIPIMFNKKTQKFKKSCFASVYNQTLNSYEFTYHQVYLKEKSI